MEKKEYYLGVIFGGVDPHIFGPEPSRECVERKARLYASRDDPDGSDVLFWIEAPEGSSIKTGAFTVLED